MFPCVSRFFFVGGGPKSITKLDGGMARFLPGSATGSVAVYSFTTPDGDAQVCKWEVSDFSPIEYVPVFAL